MLVKSCDSFLYYSIKHCCCAYKQNHSVFESLMVGRTGKMQHVVNNSQNYNIMRRIIIKHFISISGGNWADLLNQRFLPILNILCSSFLHLRPKRVIRFVLEKKPSLLLSKVFILVVVIKLLHL